MIYLKNIASYNSVPFLYGKAFLLEVLKSGQIKINFTNLDFRMKQGVPFHETKKLPFGVFKTRVLGRDEILTRMKWTMELEGDHLQCSQHKGLYKTQD